MSEHTGTGRGEAGDRAARRWLALLILCLGELMIVLDTTIVNVALPAIRTDLGFTETSLAWVLNAYLLTFGGFLLLGARLGDLFGHRRLFLAGIALFTVASLSCGLAGSQEMLVTARSVQGLGGAVVSAVALSLITTMFTEAADRAKAMGIFGFVSAGGRQHRRPARRRPDRRVELALDLPREPSHRGRGLRPLADAAAGVARRRGSRRIDVGGAVSVTAASMLAVYAIVNGNEAGWTSLRTLGLLGGAAALVVVFLAVEGRVRSPLVPLGIVRRRRVATANVVGVLWSAAMFAWFFLSALYLQRVLGYSAFTVGLAFLPTTLIMGGLSVGLSAKLVVRFGIRGPLASGLLLSAAGLALFARAPVGGSFARDVLPSMVLLGLGAGMSFNPLLLAAMSDVAPSEAGLASGAVNTSFMMGGAIGLAVLASLAAARRDHLLASGQDALAALDGGYQVAFLAGALFAAAAAVLSAALLRSGHTSAAPEGAEVLAAPAA